MKSIKILVQLGYRRWGELRFLKRKIKQATQPEVKVIGPHIKDYF